MRRAAAATLRHLAERDTAAVLSGKTEFTLFLALDTERDAQVAALLKAAIRTLLKAGANEEPSYWLNLLSEVSREG